jgi:fructose-1,6-bisphosphatase/inositol monophosphatase family enzyme
MRNLEDDLAFALALADEADAITLSQFRLHFEVHDKEDGTVVTDVDRATEAELRRRIIAARPTQRAHSTRGLGDFWQHMLVAEGAIDFAVDTMLRVWDFAAVKLIVEEAGGRFTNLAGKPPEDSDACMSSNGRLHDEVLRVIRGGAPAAESRVTAAIPPHRRRFDADA